MKTLALLTALLLTPAIAARAQTIDPPDGSRITSAQVSGLELTKLSLELQDAIARLAGTPLNRDQLKDLAARIEKDQPRLVAALRITADPDGGARVVFVVARMRDPDHQANVNAKYVVEIVDVRGVAETALSTELRADLQALTGKPLDPDQAERLETRLKAEFPEYDVTRRTMRGAQSGRVTVIFELKKAEWARWLRFQPLKTNALYHSDQGWGAFVDLPIGGRDIRFTPIFALDHADDLVEEYSGLGLRFETRKLGTERLGASLEWSWFDQNWRDPTLAALAANPAIPRLYENRTTFTPLVTFAATRQLWIGGGVSIVELEPPDSPELPESPFAIPASQMANAAVGQLGYTLRQRGSSGSRHDVDAVLTVRSGLAELESDLVYTRSLLQADYVYRSSRHRVLISGLAGFIDGDAPLFERFTLGDSRTLRGWNKYEIAPAGADQMAHVSAEYRYRIVALFVDAGSVWNKGQASQVRVSTGFGLVTGPFYMTVGIPLNTDDLTAAFMIGLRMPIGAQR